MEPLLELGINIFLIGMGVLFAALGLLMLIIYLLGWIFKDRSAEVPAEPGRTADIHDHDEDQLEELAVALAVGVSLLDVPGDDYPGLGLELERPPGRWWNVGRNKFAPYLDRNGERYE